MSTSSSVVHRRSKPPHWVAVAETKSSICSVCGSAIPHPSWVLEPTETSAKSRCGKCRHNVNATESPSTSTRVCPGLSGPVTVETYQWFVRNAERISDAYAIVICDEAHTALGEKTSACIRRWPEPVFIGMTASGLLDVFSTPFGEGVSPGIQLHAAMADSLLSNRFVRVAPDRVRVWTTIGLALAVALMAAAVQVLEALDAGEGVRPPPAIVWE